MPSYNFVQTRNVVLLQSDPHLTQLLVAKLSHLFAAVREAHSVDDLRTCAAKRRAEVLILDMEAIPVSDMAQLSHDYPEVSILCNHRLADDDLWLAALNAGAEDCFASHDTRGILQAAARNKLQAHRMAA